MRVLSVQMGTAPWELVLFILNPSSRGKQRHDRWTDNSKIALNRTVNQSTLSSVSGVSGCFVLRWVKVMVVLDTVQRRIEYLPILESPSTLF